MDDDATLAMLRLLCVNISIEFHHLMLLNIHYEFYLNDEHFMDEH